MNIVKTVEVMTSFPDEYKLGACVRCHRFDTRAPNRDIIGVQGNISSLIGWHLGKWSTHVWVLWQPKVGCSWKQCHRGKSIQTPNKCDIGNDTQNGVWLCYNKFHWAVKPFR